MAVKYAGLVGKEVQIVGANRQTVGGESKVTEKRNSIIATSMHIA
jgi:hypothetical protein